MKKLEDDREVSMELVDSLKAKEKTLKKLMIVKKVPKNQRPNITEHFKKVRELYLKDVEPN